MLFSPATRRVRTCRGGRSARRTVVERSDRAIVYTSVDPDRRGTRCGAPMLALYIGGMGSRERTSTTSSRTRTGSRDRRTSPEPVPRGSQAGGRGGAARELLETVCLCGPAARIRERLADYRDAGVDILGITPLAADLGGRLEALRTLAELVG